MKPKTIGCGLVVLACIIMPVALRVIRIDAFYNLDPWATTIDRGNHRMEITAAHCPESGGKYAIPGTLAPNDQANGLQLKWQLADRDQADRIQISDISGQIRRGDENWDDLEIILERWHGETTRSTDVHHAFVASTEYPDLMPVGQYKIRITYKFDGSPESVEEPIHYARKRKLGIHFPFYSRYF